MTTQNTSSDVLVCRGITKSYGAVAALRGVDLRLTAGTVVAIFGDNGAGKSTLVRCLSGAEVPDNGSIALGGETVALSSVADARAYGIEILWQDLALATCLDASGNVFLSREKVAGPSVFPRLLRPLKKREMARDTAARLREFNFTFPLKRVPVSALSGGQRQQLAFARTASWASSVVFMDEPTAALSVPQRRKVLSWCRDTARRGTTVVIVGHALDELLEISDEVVVMRQGRVAYHGTTHSATVDEIVSYMVGAKGPVQ